MKKIITLFICLLLIMFLHASVVNAIEQQTNAEPQQSKSPIAPPRRDVPGQRFSLSLGTLYVPDFFKPDINTGLEMMLFFHGASWCSEQNFYDARKNAVLISITVKNYGYPELFNNPALLRKILEETTTTLSQNHITSTPLRKICLASFSGGYSAIREILKHTEFLPLISDVVLADSLYAPRVEGTTDTLVWDSITPFLSYAKRASQGGPSFWFSHLYPPEKQHQNNTTTLTASYLIDKVGAERNATSSKNSRGAQLLYRADKSNFHILGYAGMTTQDHFEHFYALSDLLHETSLSSAPVPSQLPGFSISPHFKEQVKLYTFEPEVRIFINAPAPYLLDPQKPTHIILYMLPNGNSIEQTFGKKVAEGVDWHFGIQHIGAQTRRLREILVDENIIVAYLEAGGKSWPAWRSKHPDEKTIIQNIVESIKKEVSLVNPRVSLACHSGGGSFIFGFINGVEVIPDSIERIIFLDANYGYSDEDKHGDKIIAWLNAASSHYLVVICYDDRNVTYNGKLIVGPTGGTYRKTEKLVQRIQKDVSLDKSEERDLIRYRGMNSQIDIIMHKNPENKILHTVLVGDMNGFIHAVTSGTTYENKVALFNGPLAYEQWIQSE